ncbi:hypothetical protein [Tenacibaculum sp. 190130A14a]|uniref:Uncharacterized protein n=1 Tax=Tenacibaculum polynesiense TaxID=3137857 RepID=A0ABM9PG50_9FLAO
MKISNNLKKLVELKKSLSNKTIDKQESINVLKQIVLDTNYDAFNVNEKNVLVNELEKYAAIKQKLKEIEYKNIELSSENKQLKEFLLLNDEQRKKIENIGRSLI